MSYAPPQRRAHASQRATGRFGVGSILFVIFTAFALVMATAASAADPPESASWHGRAIQNPHRLADAVSTTVSSPAGWAAGPVRFGTGLQRPGGSERVREVQRRLWNLGFRPGPVDGKFGPVTRAAVQWFQIKHGYRPDGVVDLRTLTLLRERTGAAPAAAPRSVRQPVRGKRPAARGPSPQPQPGTRNAEGGAHKPAGEHGGTTAPLGLIAVVLLLLAAALVFIANRRRGGAPQQPPKTRRPAVPHREGALGPVPQPKARPEQSTAIGYVRVNGDRGALGRHATVIRQACSRRGWKVAELVRDEQTGSNGTAERPGLAAVMERLSTAGESRLVVSKLAHLSRSAAELTSLFEWFAKNGARVVAVDAGIDTTTPEGERAAQVLLTKVARRQADAGGKGGDDSNGSGRKREVEFAGVGANGKGDHG
jgi:Resolvase, N terminal domain/Putative peptidoglycan binding domain